MVSGIDIRPAAVQDAPAIVPLLEQLGYPSSLSDVHRRLMVILQHPDCATWVAQHGETIVGFSGARLGYAYEVNDAHGQLTALVVDPEFRGRGLGTALVYEAEKWVEERGGGAMVLNSGKHRNEAHHFYKGLGYTATGLRFIKEFQ